MGNFTSRERLESRSTRFWGVLEAKFGSSDYVFVDRRSTSSKPNSRLLGSVGCSLWFYAPTLEFMDIYTRTHIHSWSAYVSSSQNSVSVDAGAPAADVPDGFTWHH